MNEKRSGEHQGRVLVRVRIDIGEIGEGVGLREGVEVGVGVAESVEKEVCVAEGERVRGEGNGESVRRAEALCVAEGEKTRDCVEVEDPE